MTSQRGERPIDLLRDHNAGQSVRQCHGAQRQQHVRTLPPFPGQAVSAANQEHQFSGTQFRLPDKFGEPGGAKRPALRIQGDLCSCAMLCEQAGMPAADLAHLDPCPPRRATDKLSRHPFAMLVPAAPDEVQEDVHSLICMPAGR